MEVMTPAPPLPGISISLYSGVWRGSFPTARPVLAWAPREGADGKEHRNSGRKESSRSWREGRRSSLGSGREGPGWQWGPLRQRVHVAGSPGARLSCCSQLRSPSASWMRSGGHGQGCLPDTHTERPLRRWQLSAQNPLCLQWPCLLPPAMPYQVPGLGKLRHILDNACFKGRTTLLRWSRKGPQLISPRIGTWAS